MTGQARDRRKRGGSAAGLALAALLAATPAVAPARADEGFRCELEEARGVPAGDAQTAAELVCAEIRKASGGHGAFTIDLRTLGEIVVVTATREEPGASVTVHVQGVEEILTAAPRVADALVRGLGFAKTQRVDNLLVEETRQPRVKKGSVKFSFGIADVESPGFGARSAGFSLGVLYATPLFALPAELRVDWDDSPYGEKTMDVFSFSVGARRYLSRKDTSPFVGAGLGVLGLDAGDGFAFYADRFGVAPYVEAGVEMLRTHRGRVALHLRADVPLGALETPEIPARSYPDGRGGTVDEPGIPAESRYVVPVSIGVTLSF